MKSKWVTKVGRSVLDNYIGLHLNRPVLTNSFILLFLVSAVRNVCDSYLQ